MIINNNVKSYIRIFAVLMIFLILTPMATYLESVNTVRIGIFFNDDKTGIKTALPQLTVNAQKGMEVGFQKNASFQTLYQDLSNYYVSFMRDVYYIKNNNVFTEYFPTNGDTDSTGERIGPYHIQIGGSFESAIAALNKIEELKNSGITNAYIAYVGTWQVWVGSYTSVLSAEDDIADNLSAKTFEEAFNVVEPSPTRIIAMNIDSQVLLAFDDKDSYLQVRPNVQNDPYMLRIKEANNAGYRGCVELRRIANGNINVINILNIENYLYGVLPGEIGAGAPQEALKAQAVAARNYTLNNIGKYGRLGFDLCNTVFSQVYKGYNSEDPRTNKAVDDTAGKRLMYNGKVARVFYFSSDGGMTEDVVNVWGSSIPYLTSVEDKYESGKSWNSTWEKSLTGEKIKEILAKDGVDIGNILDVKITKFSAANRAIELTISGTKGQKVYQRERCRTIFALASQMYTITSDSDIFIKSLQSDTSKTQLMNKQVLSATGITSINSDNVVILNGSLTKKTAQTTPKTFKFNGKGWGHAVGMSQDGAMGMAKAGFKYNEILEHYFKGAKVE